MEFKLNINGKEYRIEVESKNGGEIEVKIGNEKFIFQKEKRGQAREISVAKTSLPKRNFSPKKIKAPIAGTVSKIFIKQDEFIKKGTKVILLSAMKMENEIVSDFEGKIKKILVTENQRVQEQDPLIILE